MTSSFSVLVQLCWEAAGTTWELPEDAAGGDHDQDGGSGQGLYEE